MYIYYNLMFYTAHGAYSRSESSCRNLERVVLVSESTVYHRQRLIQPKVLDK